jgi:hypothetical protein
MITKEQIEDVMKFARMAMQTGPVAVARLEEVERLALAGLAVQPRPIEEAPKDVGNKILAFNERYSWGQCYWTLDDFAKRPRPYWNWVGKQTTDSRTWPPTHFIPLSALGKPGVK